MSRTAKLLALCLLGAGCDDPTIASHRVELRLPHDGMSSLEQLEFSQPERVVERRQLGSQVLLRVTGSEPFSVSAPDLCRLSLDSKQLEAGAPQQLRSLLSVEDQPQLGFDQPFQLEVQPGCREALTGSVRWQQVGGDPIQTKSEKNGFLLSGRTRPLSLDPASLPWGIVPVSPRTRGEIVLEAVWQQADRRLRRSVRLSAAARASGIPSVALGQRVLLGASSFSVKSAPRGSEARVDVHPGYQSLLLDRPGRFVLTDQSGRELSLRAGTHRDTPLDCGRAECHQQQTLDARASPMTHALQRLLAKPGRGHVACALPCHTAGEPGLADGGFVNVTRELGLSPELALSVRGLADLPRALRRLGGVTCTACHGPGAIPEPGARWAILRSDVCATCHDAPPRYTRVAEWRRGRMARSDAAPETRVGDCAGCHTTPGFLTRIGARSATEVPAQSAGFGIACPACHAAHDAHAGGNLIRRVALTAGFPRVSARDALCISCHGSAQNGRLPAASSANLVYEVGPLPPDSSPTAHQSLGGCVACHGGDLGSARSSTHHDFKARAELCENCHARPFTKPELDRRRAELTDRARAILRSLANQSAKSPPHASAGGPISESRQRARTAALLVLEDPAAAVHNARYARRLLDAAETWLLRGQN